MSDNGHIEVLPVGFEPARRGRNHLVEIHDLLAEAVDNAGRWVSKSYTEREAVSVLRQLKNYDVEAVSKKAGADQRTVYIKHEG